VYSEEEESRKNKINMSAGASAASRIFKKGFDLSTQRRMAMAIFGVGKRKVWLDPAKLPIIAKAKTRTPFVVIFPFVTGNYFFLLSWQRFGTIIYRLQFVNFIRLFVLDFRFAFRPSVAPFPPSVHFFSLFLPILGESIRELISKDVVRIMPTHRGRHFGRVTEQLIAANPVTKRIKAQYAQKSTSTLSTTLTTEATPAAASS
jgi:hypothetical protein